MATYSFEYDEIEHCHVCPLFYDFIYCEIDPKSAEHSYVDHTDEVDHKRPDWCKLKEVNEND